MNEDFVPFELAVKLKEKGFREPCVATYDKDGMLGYNYYQLKSIKAVSFDDCLCISDDLVLAPTISQVLKWLREKKNILVCVLPTGWNHVRECSLYYYVVYDTSNYYWKREVYQQSFETYKETELAGIEYVLDNWI